MDVELRDLARRVEEDGSELDRRKLRRLQWRNGVKLKLLPGDIIEFKKYSNKTRGILIKKTRIVFETVIDDAEDGITHRERKTCWFVKKINKVRNTIYCVVRDVDRLVPTN